MRKSETKWKQTPPKKRAKVRYHMAGNIKVGIYQFSDREIVFWEESGARKLKNFTKVSRTQEADEFAINKVKELAVMLQGGVTLLQGNEARSYAVAKTLQAELNNVPLDVILREVVAALKLSGATSITECAKLYRMIHGQIKTIKTNTAVDEFLVTLKEDTRHHDDLKSRLWHLPPDNGSGGADADHYRLLRLGRRGVVAVPIFFAGQRGHVLSLLIAQTDHEDSPSGLPPTWKK